MIQTESDMQAASDAVHKFAADLGVFPTVSEAEVRVVTGIVMGGVSLAPEHRDVYLEAALATPLSPERRETLTSLTDTVMFFAQADQA